MQAYMPQHTASAQLTRWRELQHCVVLHTAGASYCFASCDEEFLRANFDSRILDLLPWEVLTAKSGVNRELADTLRRSRGDGTAVLEVCRHRNEAVADR